MVPSFGPLLPSGGDLKGPSKYFLFSICSISFQNMIKLPYLLSSSSSSSNPSSTLLSPRDHGRDQHNREEKVSSFVRKSTSVPNKAHPTNVFFEKSLFKSRVLWKFDLLKLPRSLHAVSDFKKLCFQTIYSNSSLRGICFSKFCGRKDDVCYGDWVEEWRYLCCTICFRYVSPERNHC